MELKIEDATTTAEALPIIVANVWRTDIDEGKHDGDPDAPPVLLDEAELAAWLPHCPKDAIEESRRRLADIDRKRHKPAHERPIHPSTHTLAQAAGIDADVQDVAMVVERGAEVPPGKATWGNDAQWRWLPELANADTDEKRTWGSLPLLVPVVLRGSAISAPDILWLRWAPNAWKALTPLVRAWLDAQPRPEHAETRQDRRVLPRIEVADKRKAQLAAFLADADSAEATAELPLFPEAPKRKQVPLLDLCDAAGLPVLAKGQGAPLLMRLIVQGLMAVKPELRRRTSVPFQLTLRELVGLLYPNGWNRTLQWPRLLRALKQVDDVYYPMLVDGRVFNVWPLKLNRAPADDPRLDDPISFAAYFPPGTGAGPTIDLPELAKLGNKDVASYRAYIGAMSVAWRTGVTRVPVRGGQWLWASDPDAYGVLTADDRRRIAFGADGGNATKAEVDAAFDGLPGIVVAAKRVQNPRTGEVGWRVLPAEAASAIEAERGRTKRRS